MAGFSAWRRSSFLTIDVPKTERRTVDIRKNPVYLIQHLDPVLDDTLSFEFQVDEAFYQHSHTSYTFMKICY